ncbi:MAG: epimerase [Candidatus Levybacteria bacterium RIFCSPHIGHO2_02_FULL_40_18]|nr:MAG: epimerase [Candidatus Levybacteria bacterium RIFCSPHIGHO2_01_FULL_40_58]OGH27279.1 MAG: epimerase [Candidatus Levybacteria bacterium RIFCSPHIGHO2_02_FULL_40_18]OGH31130.1 MAG: epimerase [Candidatus Levybacteria bacterium RIFCSPHIGHO2_12_FULL_40_31]OGH40791.1 MAG: epimerase [Candidatus Levybacteria bacterium RIFCSPLOWO2_01_FULL_40_64]OGH49465.1 MAG: epimerase [Candidatus Levybacteria bacterium RIFCSPLOWO2_02_FULL_41_11]OGH53976.1 MAG: epimerase [Candidatus Levybacteria bacterium RIFCSPL
MPYINLVKKTKKKIFITGAAGFIGSNVLEYLFKKYKNYYFTVLDALTYAGNLRNFLPEMMNDKRFHFVYGDVTNNALVDNLVRDSDVVIHFAAETHVTRSIHDNRKFFETDVLGTQSVANAVYHHKKRVERFIHISTCEVYGHGLTRKMDESHPLNPHSPYAAAKAGADRLVYSYYITYGIPVIILRPFNIYGPRQHLEKAIPRFITSALSNDPLPLHGGGKSKRDYMHVSDVATAIDLLIRAPLKKVKGEVFNIGSGKAISILQIAKSVAKHMKIPESRIKIVKDRPGQVSGFACDYSKIKKLLGWEPKKDMRIGLIETIAWYRENKDIWNLQTWLKSVPIVLPDGTTEHH